MKMSDAEKDKLVDWWKSLHENRGDRAVLGRAKSPYDILASRAFYNFLRDMPESWREENNIRFFDAAMVASLVARIREDDSGSSFIASLASPANKGKRPVVSELRFQRLLRCHDEEEFFLRMRRIIDLLGRKVNIRSFVDGLLLWLDDKKYSKNKALDKCFQIVWAKEYFENLQN